MDSRFMLLKRLSLQISKGIIDAKGIAKYTGLTLTQVNAVLNKTKYNDRVRRKMKVFFEEVTNFDESKDAETYTDVYRKKIKFWEGITRIY